MDQVPSADDSIATVTSVEGSATPDDLNIQSRNRHFASAPMENRYWAGGDPYGTAFFNAHGF